MGSRKGRGDKCLLAKAVPWKEEATKSLTLCANLVARLECVHVHDPFSGSSSTEEDILFVAKFHTSCHFPLPIC